MNSKEIYENIKKVSSVIELENEKEEFLKIESIMKSIPDLKERFIIVKFLEYITQSAAFHICHHPNTKKISQTNGRDQIEICEVCGLKRNVWIQTDKDQEYDMMHSNEIVIFGTWEI